MCKPINICEVACVREGKQMGIERHAPASTQAQVARGTYAHRLLLVCAGCCN